MKSASKPLAEVLTKDRFDSVMEWLLIALLVFAPLAFGAVDAWSEEILLLLAGGLGISLAAKLVIHKDQPFFWSWSYLPMIIFLALIALQVSPLPSTLVRVLSPAGYRIQNQHPFVNSLHSYTSTLSLYPAETRRELRLLLGVSTVFVVSVNLLRTSARIVKLLSVVAAIGMIEAIINLMQFISGTTKVLWIVPMANLYSGTFAGHAHFGQWINLSCGAMIAIALVKLNENRATLHGRTVNAATIAFDRRYRIIWLMILCVALAFTAMCISLTRGGMLGALLAAVITIATATCKKRLQNKSGYIILGILAISNLLLLTGFDGVYDRLATLRDYQKAGDVRPQMFRDLIPEFKAFPLFGTGLGSYATVYPLFQTILVPGIAYTADDQYVQALEETGVVGVLVMGSFLGMIAFSYIKILRMRTKPIRTAALGLAFGIIAILIQSCSDFGQQIPSLACLTALFCGILVVLTTLSSTSSLDDKTAPSLSRVGFASRCAALLVVLLVALCIVLLPADRARRAEASWKNALCFDQVARCANWQVGDDLYAGLIDSAQQAARLEPDDVRYAYWLSVYRWQSVARKVNGPVDPALLAARQRVGSRVVSDLLQASQLCPTYAPPYATAAQIEYAALNRPDLAVTFMNKALQLGRSDPAILMPAAELDIHLGHVDATVPLLRDCIKANSGLAGHALDLLLAKDRSDLAIQICQNNAAQLADLLNQLPRPGDPATPTQTASRTQLQTKLAQLCQQPDTQAWVLAVMGDNLLQQNNPASASEYFQRALEKDYSNIYWRLRLAQALVATGQTDAAIAEVRSCKRMAPERGDVRNYLQELLNRPRASALHTDQDRFLNKTNLEHVTTVVGAGDVTQASFTHEHTTVALMQLVSSSSLGHPLDVLPERRHRCM